MISVLTWSCHPSLLLLLRLVSGALKTSEGPLDRHRLGRPAPHLRLLLPQSCPSPCDPMDCSLPGSSVHGIFQARIPACLRAKSLQSCPTLFTTTRLCHHGIEATMAGTGMNDLGRVLIKLFIKTGDGPWLLVIDPHNLGLTKWCGFRRRRKITLP